MIGLYYYKQLLRIFSLQGPGMLSATAGTGGREVDNGSHGENKIIFVEGTDV